MLTLSKEMKDMEKELNDMRSAHNKLISAVEVSLNFLILMKNSEGT